MTLTPIEVSQADRDAAADLYALLNGVWDGYSTCVAIREGGEDEMGIVQAFARRAAEAFEQGRQSANADLVEALKKIAGLRSSALYNVSASPKACLSRARNIATAALAKVGVV